MTDVRAITLRQPWASLITVGAKTIETRSWSTDYRGPLVIHAGAKPLGREWDGPQGQMGHFGGDVWNVHRKTDEGAPVLIKSGGTWWDTHYMPFGAAVAECTLADVVPMRDGRYYPPDTEETWLGLYEDALLLRHRVPGAGVTDRPVTDQRPFGDFAPGRFAWLLTDVTPLDPPIPAKGRLGLWPWPPPLPMP